MKIKRTTANKIISMANRLSDDCLLGILDTEEKVILVDNEINLQKLMDENPEAIFLHNQSALSIQIRDKIIYLNGQKLIEIFQQTKGVSELRAYIQTGKMKTITTLELSDE